MKFYSEITKQFYDSADTCASEEKSAKEKIEKQEAEKKALTEAKATRAKEVTEAYKAVREAQKHYDELRNKFVQDYGYFHMSFTDPDEKTPFSFFEDIFRF